MWGCEILALVCSSVGKLPNVEQKQVAQQVVHHVSRWGKYIIFKLDKGYLISHLRMTGQWLFSPAPPYSDRAFRWALSMRDHEGRSSGYLWFRDSRRFGTFDWVPSLTEYEPFSRLGIDGLVLDDPKEVFKIVVQARKTRRPIKTFLLDQSIIAGVGSIYCAEILYETGVNPTIKTRDLSDDKIREICFKVYEIFMRAIDLGGSSISDYTGGRYHEVLHVYQRAGEPCDTCGATIKRIIQAGRSTFFCPKCQGAEDGIS